MLIKTKKKKRKYPHRCDTKFCRGIATEAGHSHHCGNCRTERFKDRHPLRYYYNKLKYRAAERGHAFTLTYEEYCAFAEKTGYLYEKGKTAKALSINRIDNTKGYSADNIEVCLLSVNSRLQYAPMPDWLKDQLTAGTPADQIESPHHKLLRRAGMLPPNG